MDDLLTGNNVYLEPKSNSSQGCQADLKTNDKTCSNHGYQYLQQS